MFQLCFSTGVSENLPLWFLYSGTNGKGARLKFIRNDILKWIASKNMKMVLYNESNKVADLEIDNNCEIYFQDILYITKENNSYRAKYNNKMFTNIDEKTIDKYKEKYSGFYKGIIWFYEKETRLLLKIKDEKLLDKEVIEQKKEAYHIELDIPDFVYKNIDITFSPQYKTSEDIEEEYHKEGFKKLIKTKKLSDYAGQIDIDLCANCKEKCINKECENRE